MRYVPDTNALIYLLDNRLEQPFPSGQYGYSVITEIELLSWPKMQPQTDGDCAACWPPCKRNAGYLMGVNLIMKF